MVKRLLKVLTVLCLTIGLFLIDGSQVNAGGLPYTGNVKFVNGTSTDDFDLYLVYDHTETSFDNIPQNANVRVESYTLLV